MKDQPKGKPTVSEPVAEEKRYTVKQIDAVLDRYYYEVKQSKTPSNVDLFDLKKYVAEKLGNVKRK